jgi:hypothetical protein
MLLMSRWSGRATGGFPSPYLLLRYGPAGSSA